MVDRHRILIDVEKIVGTHFKSCLSPEAYNSIFCGLVCESLFVSRLGSKSGPPWLWIVDPGVGTGSIAKINVSHKSVGVMISGSIFVAFGSLGDSFPD